MLLIVLALLGGDASSLDAPERRLLNSLVFNTCDIGDVESLPGGVRARVREYVDRCHAFTPRVRSLPGLSPGEREMTDTARQNYERRLWAAARDSSPRTAALVAAYVEALRPCYEWEGFHDCPEREAVFAEKYLRERPASPFTACLSLLAAHRWVCAAEAYEYEQGSHVPASRNGVGGSRARQSFQRDLTTALASPDPLVRFAARQLKESAACF